MSVDTELYRCAPPGRRSPAGEEALHAIQSARDAAAAVERIARELAGLLGETPDSTRTP